MNLLSRVAVPRRSYIITRGSSVTSRSCILAIYLGAVHCFTATIPTRQHCSFIVSTSRERIIHQNIHTAAQVPFGKNYNSRTKSNNNILTMTMTVDSSQGRKESNGTQFENDPSSSLPKLVDVDCNLINKDLIGLMSNEDDENLDHLEIPDELKILHHPSTTNANIGAMLAPSSKLSESQKMVEILTNCKESQLNCILVGTTVGVHPYDVQEEGLVCEEKIQLMESLLSSDIKSQTNVVKCVGECGLDYSPGFPDKEYQLPWFEAQIKLAIQHQIPLFIHERLAFQDTLDLLDKCSTESESKSLPPIIIHCFTGSYEECQEYVRRGYHLSISGYILKKGSEAVRKCLIDGIIPLDKLMIETDAPYMGFATCRDDFYHASGDSFQSLSNKQRKKLLKSNYPNVPSALPLVLKAVLDLLNEGRINRNNENNDSEDAKLMTLHQLAEITSRNSHSFFGFKA